MKGLTETIPAVFRLLTNKEVALPSFSVTSALPSIMNGGKDFSEWSKKDDLLYKTLRLPVEAVLGRDSVCLADCAIAESKFEKGEDVAGRMLSLLPQMNEVRNRGTSDMEFAVSGLLARSQLASGQPADARRTIEVLREYFAERGLTRFLPNMDAMLCRIDMHTGDLDAADAGGVLHAFPRTQPCSRRGADAHGTANSPSALCGQVQHRDCTDHGREAAHGEDPRQPHSRQAGREAPG